MHKKPLSIETEDMESIEFNFLKQYSKYLVKYWLIFNSLPRMMKQSMILKLVRRKSYKSWWPYIRLNDKLFLIKIFKHNYQKR